MCTPIFQGICILSKETQIKRENLKKAKSDDDNRFFGVFLTKRKPLFGVF